MDAVHRRSLPTAIRTLAVAILAGLLLGAHVSRTYSELRGKMDEFMLKASAYLLFSTPATQVRVSPEERGEDGEISERWITPVTDLTIAAIEHIVSFAPNDMHARLEEPGGGDVRYRVCNPSDSSDVLRAVSDLLEGQYADEMRSYEIQIKGYSEDEGPPPERPRKPTVAGFSNDYGHFVITTSHIEYNGVGERFRVPGYAIWFDPKDEFGIAPTALRQGVLSSANSLGVIEADPQTAFLRVRSLAGALKVQIPFVGVEVQPTMAFWYLHVLLTVLGILLGQAMREEALRAEREGSARWPLLDTVQVPAAGAPAAILAFIERGMGHAFFVALLAAPILLVLFGWLGGIYGDLSRASGVALSVLLGLNLIAGLATFLLAVYARSRGVGNA